MSRTQTADELVVGTKAEGTSRIFASIALSGIIAAIIYIIYNVFLISSDAWVAPI